ncbi:NUDIX hydrolase [Streptomyces sp. DSM 118878]
MRILTKGSVALIGSFRQHYPEVLAVARVFAGAGLAVGSPPICRIVDRGREFVRFESDPPESSDQDLQAATLEKIFTSDLVYVVNPGGYIGRTTAYELGRVHERGMAVYYAEPPKDLPIAVPEETVIDARRLVEIITGSVPGPAPVRRPRVAAQPTADIVIFTIRMDQLRVLLVRRGKKPYRGMLALPGGFVRPGESLEGTAERELREETGLSDSRIRLEQLHTYSRPERDPRGRIISTAFLAVMPDPPEVTGASDAREADWVEVEESLWGHNSSLAFDHGKILRHGLDRIRTRLEHTTAATAFCDELFTITDLRKVYEAVWGYELNPGNFHRKVVEETAGFVIRTDKVRRSGPGKPPALFRRGTANLLYPPMVRGRRSP